MNGLAAVLIGGPPATGKSTLAAALAPRLGAALLDLDVAGVHDLDDPALARLTREARYDTLIGLAAANLRTGRPVVLVAPFSTERADPSAWATTTRRLEAEPTLVWLHLLPDELIRRLARRLCCAALPPAGQMRALPLPGQPGSRCGARSQE